VSELTGKEALLEQIGQALLNEDQQLTESLVKKALDEKISASEIISKGFAPALVVAGDRYAKFEFFLTDLMIVGEITKAAMEIMDPYLKGERAGVAAKGKVVIGTVEGDIHDIGKNIVTAVLSGSGFEVTDIGIDQPSKKFAEKAKELNADIVGASAILGASKGMVRVINEELQKAGIRDNVGLICGGWGFTEQVAKNFGADHGCDDAWIALKYAEELTTKLKEKRKK